MNGVNIYHAGMPHLEGKNLWDLTDKTGKKTLQMAIAALADKTTRRVGALFLVGAG